MVAKELCCHQLPKCCLFQHGEGQHMQQWAGIPGSLPLPLPLETFLRRHRLPLFCSVQFPARYLLPLLVFWVPLIESALDVQESYLCKLIT